MKTKIDPAGGAGNAGRVFGTLLLLALATFPCAGRLFAVSLEDLLGPGQAAALISGERPSEIQFKNPRLLLLPRHGPVRAVIEDARGSLDPGIMVETLYLYKKPAAAARPLWTEAERLGLYNGILALSTLTGLQYYSASRKTMRTFYESSHVIDDPSAKTAAPDPVFQIPRDRLTIFARQKDMTFGDNTYQYDYYSFPDALILVQENLSSLNYGIITAVGKNKLRSVMAVIDAGEYLLVYAVSMAKAASLPGMKERIGNSFSNRAEAMLKWFEGQAGRAFVEGGPAN
ncbi:MAG: hypothetical protein LBB83_06795 [Treponema sp.]|jgi:hypothetical protein|nr:hypothetical protein [Treponema sp.]